MEQQTVARYIKGTLENRVVLICRISGFFTICYFSKLFHILIVLKMKTWRKFYIFQKYIIILHYHCLSKKKTVADLQNESEIFSAEILNNIKNSIKNTLQEHVTQNFII